MTMRSRYGASHTPGGVTPSGHIWACITFVTVTTTALFAWTTPLPVHAQSDFGSDSYLNSLSRERHAEQPSWALMFRAGPYRPHVSSNAEARQLYRKIFTGDHEQSLVHNRPLLKTLEMDWYVWQDFGQLALTTELGQWRAEGRSLHCTDSAGAAKDCTPEEALTIATSSNDVTTLTVVPITLGLSYRADMLKKNWSVPLIPYARAGVSYFLWWASAAGKTSKSRDGTKSGEGGTAGFNATVGLALGLDWLEPGTAARARRASGMAGSYLTAEMTQYYGNSFGTSKRRLDMSSRTLSLGIAIDFL